MGKELKVTYPFLAKKARTEDSPLEKEFPLSVLHRGINTPDGDEIKKDFGFNRSEKVNSSGVENNERDLILWSKIKRGEIAALGELYDLYIDILFPYGISLSSDKVLVMDCIHDLFLELYKYRKKLADNPQVKYYLIKSLKRKVFKKAKIKESVLCTLTENDHLRLDLYEPSVEQNFIEIENVCGKKRYIEKALKTLSKKQKMVIKLKFYEGKSYEEIASLMNVTVETSRTLVYRSITALRQLLANVLLIVFFKFL